jgi:hypothetical protein
MIKYALRCEHDHTWDAWFPSISGYDDQVARGLVACPYCDSTQVEKAIMAPSVVTSRRQAAEPVEPVATTSEPKLPVAADEMSLSLPEPLKAMIAEVKAKIEATHDYVGDTFAREARAIHEGDSEVRPIYGQATPAEVKALIDDEIPVLPLPVGLIPKGTKGVH